MQPLPKHRPGSLHGPADQPPAGAARLTASSDAADALGPSATASDAATAECAALANLAADVGTDTSGAEPSWCTEYANWGRPTPTVVGQWGKSGTPDDASKRRHASHARPADTSHRLVDERCDTGPGHDRKDDDKGLKGHHFQRQGVSAL